MSDAVKRVEDYLDGFESVTSGGEYIASNGSCSNALSAKDVRAIIEENKSLKEQVREMIMQSITDSCQCQMHMEEIAKMQDEITEYKHLVSQLEGYIKNLTEK